MRRPSGVRGSSCRLRGAPTGSSNAACPSRTQDAGAFPVRADVAAPRIRRATWGAGLPPSAAPAQERGTDRSSACQAKRSEEHTSELQSLTNLVCRLLLEKKKKQRNRRSNAKEEQADARDQDITAQL